MKECYIIVLFVFLCMNANAQELSLVPLGDNNRIELVKEDDPNKDVISQILDKFKASNSNDDVDAKLFSLSSFESEELKKLFPKLSFYKLVWTYHPNKKDKPTSIAILKTVIALNEEGKHWEIELTGNNEGLIEFLGASKFKVIPESVGDLWKAICELLGKKQHSEVLPEWHNEERAYVFGKHLINKIRGYDQEGNPIHRKGNYFYKMHLNESNLAKSWEVGFVSEP